MKPISLIVVIVVSVICTGCGWVRSKEPAGETAATLDPRVWEGTWLALRTPGDVSNSITVNRAVLVQVTGPDTGVMRATWIAPNGMLRSVEFLLRDSKGGGGETDGFFSVKASELDDDQAQGGYYWGFLRRNGDLVVMWLPSAKGFRELIDEGKLQGSAVEKSDNLMLDAITVDSFKGVGMEDRFMWDLFYWYEPIVFWRVARAETENQSGQGPAESKPQ